MGEELKTQNTDMSCKWAEVSGGSSRTACFSLYVQRWYGSAWADYILLSVILLIADISVLVFVFVCSCAGNGWGSDRKDDVIVYYRSENTTRIWYGFICIGFQGDPSQNLKWTHHTHSVPFSLSQGVGSSWTLIELWRVALHESALFCSYWEQHSWE